MNQRLPGRDGVSLIAALPRQRINTRVIVLGYETSRGGEIRPLSLKDTGTSS